MQITEDTAQRLVEAIDRLTNEIKQQPQRVWVHANNGSCGGPGWNIQPGIMPSVQDRLRPV